jgi:hypothetical protein
VLHIHAARLNDITASLLLAIYKKLSAVKKNRTTYMWDSTPARYPLDQPPVAPMGTFLPDHKDIQKS